MRPSINTKRHNLLLAAVILFGFLLRLGYLLTLEERTFWEDEADYLALAQNIVNGQGYTNTEGYPTAFRPVGYPMLLAALGLAGIRSLLAIRLFQALLSTATIYLIALQTLYVFNRKAGIAAAALAGIYPYFVFMPGTVLATTWFAFLLVSASYAFVLGCDGENTKLMLASGALFGVAVLTQPSAIVLAATASLWHVVNNRRRILAASRKLLPFFIALLLILAPWMLRNTRDLDYAGLATNGGRNLWLGNNPQATSLTGSGVAMPAELERRIDASFFEAEKDQIYIREAGKFIRQNPWQFAVLSLQKAVHFWSLMPSATTPGYIEQTSAVRWISVFSFGPILLLSLLAFHFAAQGQRKHIALWLAYAAFFTVLHAVFIAKVRLRLPIDHFLIMGAGFTATYLFEKIKGSRLTALLRH